MKSLGFTLKDIITYTGFVFVLGGSYAAQAYNTKMLEQEMIKSNEINMLKYERLEEIVKGMVKNDELHTLTLRKLELEVAEMKYRRNN